LNLLFMYDRLICKSSSPKFDFIISVICRTADLKVPSSQNVELLELFLSPPSAIHLELNVPPKNSKIPISILGDCVTFEELVVTTANPFFPIHRGTFKTSLS
jgi:hypothetical protein